MAPRQAEESNQNKQQKIDPRQAALDEAASVLRAVLSSGGNSSSSVETSDAQGGSGNGSGSGGGGGSASNPKSTRGSTQSNESADNANGKSDGNDGNSNTKSTVTAPPPTKLSRSDAVAAAKRRAEERKRNKHVDRKPPAASPSRTTTTIANAKTSNATNTSSSITPYSNSSPQKQPQHQQISNNNNNNSNNNNNNTQSMDWFNLLSVVTNPNGSSSNYYDNFYSASSPSASSHYGSKSSYHNRTSRHGGLSSHGNPISLDHVGSDGTRGSMGGGGGTTGTGGTGGNAGGNNGEEGTVAATLLTAAGLSEWATTVNSSSASANATLTQVATQLDEFTGWFDHYSRKYLGTIENYSHIVGEYGQEYGADGDGGVGGYTLGNMVMSNLNLNHHAMSGGSHHLHPSMLCEYEPEFGPEDVPSSQLEELPTELKELDLASVDRYLRASGMLGMRFEDRGGGFQAVRERRKERSAAAVEDAEGKEKAEETEGEEEEEEKKVDAPSSAPSSLATTSSPPPLGNAEEDAVDMMADVESVVPDIFFSPYFDLTDPVCFENLLVISDEEVAQIREKEAELHALADRKVKEAEEVARRDARNENVVARPPAKKKAGGGGEDEATATAVAATKTPGTSLTRDSKTTSSTPCEEDNTVITLRKPETFTSHLDAIELVLLDQVRSKSERFFRETNRFSELQRLVSTSVEEVRDLRTELHSIRERCVTNVEVVPVMDDGRRDLRSISRVLESVEDVVNCKASIASLMGAGDHLGAVEAIRLARVLLKGSPEEEDDDDEDEEFDEEDGSLQPSSRRSLSHSSQQNHHLSLGKLKSLSKVSEQLNEYEKLVVQNLTDELVETFLSWGTSSDGSSGGGGANNVDYRSAPRITLTSDKRAKIRGVVKALRVCGKLGGAGAAYQRKLCELISVTVRAIVTECVADAAKNAPGGGDEANPVVSKGTMAGVAHMSLDQFFDCINMLFEQVLGLLWGAFAVNKFCIDEGFILDDNTSASSSGNADTEIQPSASTCGGGGSYERKSSHTPSATAASLAAAADLSEKSVSELLRLRREAHSLVSFDGMRRLWDTSLTFTHQLEKFSGRKAYGLRSTLLAQAKSFVERKHESNMSALVAALDSERWVQCSVSAERQAALTRLSSGRAAFSSRKTTSEAISSATPATAPSTTGNAGGREKMTDAEVEGTRYKVVWSCLLLLEMVMDDVACAAHFQTLATNVVSKVAELLRLFNARATQLVLGAGAIHSAARLKSINAKHLAIVTQCIALVLAILPHVRAALMAQLPTKQHALLYDLDKIKADYKEHSEKILSKLVSIIGGIVEHSLAPRIANTDFDARARNNSKAVSKALDADAEVECCKFLDNVVTNTRKMHQVLLVMLPAELLRDVFSRIFAYLDHKVPSLFKSAAIAEQTSFSMPIADDGKLQMINEVDYMARTLNGLPGVQPWNFTATKILEQELDIVREEDPPPLPAAPEVELCEDTESKRGIPEGDKETETIEISTNDEEDGQKEGLTSCSTSVDSLPAENAKIEECADEDSPGKELAAQKASSE